MDFPRLRALITEASHATLNRLRRLHADERFYAFALYTTEDAVGIVPALNSEEAFAKAVSAVKSDASYKSILESGGVSIEASLLGDYRWSPYEWAYECNDADAFREVNALINNRGVAPYHEDDPDGLEGFRAAVMACMVLGLQDMLTSGVVGPGNGRGDMTVFCSVADSGDAVWFEEDSARRLNSPAVFETFFQQRVKYISSDASPEESDSQTVRELYLQYFPPAGAAG